MNSEAANKLLKLVEEPFPGTYFIFITHAPEKVIDTVRSRCLRIRLEPIQLENNADTEEYRTAFTSILRASIQGDLVSVLKTAETLAATGREKQKRFCLFAEEYLRTLMRGKQETSEFSRIPADFFERAYTVIDTTRLSIESNVNAKIAFCNMCNLLFVRLSPQYSRQRP